MVAPGSSVLRAGERRAAGAGEHWCEDAEEPEGDRQERRAPSAELLAPRIARLLAAVPSDSEATGRAEASPKAANIGCASAKNKYSSAVCATVEPTTRRTPTIRSGCGSSAQRVFAAGYGHEDHGHRPQAAVDRRSTAGSARRVISCARRPRTDRASPVSAISITRRRPVGADGAGDEQSAERRGGRLGAFVAAQRAGRANQRRDRGRAIAQPLLGGRCRRRIGCRSEAVLFYMRSVGLGLLRRAAGVPAPDPEAWESLLGDCCEASAAVHRERGSSR